jgi:plastocyanin
MTGRIFAAAFLAAGAVALASACGGNDAAPSPPATTTTTTISGGGTTTTISGGGTPTITITSSGVSPKTLTVARGTQVTFTNNNSVPHDMASNPHPAHTDCPDISVGFLSPGQSRMTVALNTPRTCGYHDHQRNTDASLQGTITIQ